MSGRRVRTTRVALHEAVLVCLVAGLRAAGPSRPRSAGGVAGCNGPRMSTLGCPSPCPALTGVVPFRCSTAPHNLRKLRPLCKRPLIGYIPVAYDISSAGCPRRPARGSGSGNPTTMQRPAIRTYEHGIHAIDLGYIRPGLAASHLIVRDGRAAFVDTGPNGS